MRRRLTDVSAVSEAAANAARTSDAIKAMTRRLIARPQRRAQALRGRSPEQFADAATLVDADDRFGDERCDAEHLRLGMVIEAARPVVERHGVGDGDLVDGRLVEEGEGGGG